MFNVKHLGRRNGRHVPLVTFSVEVYDLLILSILVVHKVKIKSALLLYASFSIVASFKFCF